MCADLYDLEVMRGAELYRNDLINRIAAANIKGRVVDVGAGIGLYASAWRMRTGRAPLCLEIEPYFIESLKREGFDVCMALEDLPAGLDAAYSINVLEHIEDPVTFLKRLRAKLKNGSSLYLYVPAFSSLYSEWDQRVGHFRRYELSLLVEHVSAAGFEIEDQGYADSLGFIATWLLKKVGKTGGAVNPNSVKFYDRVIFPISRLLDNLVGRWFGKNCWVVAKAV